MRAAPAALLGLIGLSAACASWADVSAARTLIGHCAEAAEPGLRGLGALREACPGIEQALDQLGILPFLPTDWRRDLSPRALADFALLERRYADPVRWESVPPDARRLRSIALSLEPPRAPASWWERLSSWARHWLERAGGKEAGWLRFLPTWTLGPRLLQVLLIALTVLVVAAAAALVVVEIRAAGSTAGLRSRLRVRRSTQGAASGAGESPDTASLANLDSAPVRDRPILLLRALVQALMRAHRLRRDRDLTCRELIAQARFDTSRQREDFEHVALLAERALYGGLQANPALISQEMLRSAQALHEELLIARPAVTESGR
jgi:hypothetical protein